MLDPHERYVHFHQLHIAPNPPEADVIPLERFLQTLKERVIKKISKKPYSNGDYVLSIADYFFDKENQILTLLIHNSNKKATDPTFKNNATDKLRTEKKQKNEGIAVSAHMSISVKPYDDLGELHDVLLESVQGLGRSIVTPFIHSELKAISETLGFEFDDKDTKTKKKYYPKSEINGTPNQNFMDLLENKQSDDFLTGFELIRYEKKEEHDEDSYYEPVTTKVTFKLKKSNSGLSTPAKIIESVRELAKKEGYDDVKIKYKPEDGNKPSRTATATLNVSKQDLKDILILKEEKIESSTELAQCAGEIVNNLRVKMTNLLLKQRENREASS